MKNNSNMKKNIIVALSVEDYQKLVLLVSSHAVAYKGFVSISEYIRYLIRSKEVEKT